MPKKDGWNCNVLFCERIEGPFTNIPKSHKIILFEISVGPKGFQHWAETDLNIKWKNVLRFIYHIVHNFW